MKDTYCDRCVPAQDGGTLMVDYDKFYQGSFAKCLHGDVTFPEGLEWLAATIWIDTC